MSLFPIFKVNKLSNKNKTETIYVFCGSQFSEEIDDLNTLFKNDKQNEKFIDIFKPDELKIIDTNKIDVEFINQSIHIDDSIGVIKLKIFEAIEREASMSELYLFCLKSEKLNPITIYQNLTQNDKVPLSRVGMKQLLLNLYDENGKLIDFNIEDKPQYNFDDILKLDLNDKTYLVGNPLGQKIVFSNEYPFISDPFEVTEYDSLLENSRKEISTLSANLLLETGPIFRNTIYLCLAQDVFEIANINEISIEYTSKIYYPFLYKDNIDSLDELESKRNELIASTSELLTPDTERNFENIDMYYNIAQSKNKKPSVKYSSNSKLTGITSLKIIIYPEFKIKIPIDVIFKLVHATNEYPLIKYNPETRQENIYRLFAPELTVDGRKIPYLQKSAIFKLMKTIGKSKSVAIYTNIEYKGINIFMACEFESNGNITVYPLIDFESPILLNSGDNMFEDIDAIIRLTVNPLIEQIKPFFEQSGLVIPLFESIQSINVEVRDMKFQMVYNISKPIEINKYSGCISSVFVVESSNFKKGIDLRYKRVSNFNKRDSQEAFVIEKIDQGFKMDEIVAELMEQFDDLNEETATELIINVRSELEVIRGANKRRALMIKINPGFKTTMRMRNNLIASELIIVMNGINDIYYLNTIPVYINSIVQITQDIESIGIEPALINKLCSAKEIEDIEFGQITAQSEQSIEDNEVPDIKNNLPIYEEEQGEYMDELLDILGFEEDESPDGDTKSSKYEGGADSESEDLSSAELSASSVSSKSIENMPDKTIPEQDVAKNDEELNLSELDSLESLESLGSLESVGYTKEKDSVSKEKDSVSKEKESKQELSNPASSSSSSSSSSSLSESSLSEEPTKDELTKDELTKDELTKEELTNDELTKDELTKGELTKDELTNDELIKGKSSKEESSKESSIKGKSSKDESSKGEQSKDDVDRESVMLSKDDAVRESEMSSNGDSSKEDTDKEKELLSKEELPKDLLSESSSSKSSSSKSSSSESSSSESSSSKSSSSESSSSESSSSESSSSKEAPRKDDLRKEEPIKEESTKEGPRKEESAKEESAKEESSKEEPIKEESTKEEPRKEESTKEESAKEEPRKEETAKEDLAK
jgi:hypothetical protein